MSSASYGDTLGRCEAATEDSLASVRREAASTAHTTGLGGLNVPSDSDLSLHPILSYLWLFTLKLRMLRLKLQYFGKKADSLEKILILGKIEGKRRGWQRMRWLDGITDSTGMSLSKLRDIVKDREAWRAAVHGIAKLDMSELQQNAIQLEGFSSLVTAATGDRRPSDWKVQVWDIPSLARTDGRHCSGEQTVICLFLPYAHLYSESPACTQQLQCSTAFRFF